MISPCDEREKVHGSLTFLPGRPLLLCHPELTLHARLALNRACRCYTRRASYSHHGDLTVLFKVFKRNVMRVTAGDDDKETLSGVETSGVAEKELWCVSSENVSFEMQINDSDGSSSVKVIHEIYSSFTFSIENKSATYPPWKMWSPPFQNAKIYAIASCYTCLWMLLLTLYSSITDRCTACYVKRFKWRGHEMQSLDSSTLKSLRNRCCFTYILTIMENNRTVPPGVLQV